MKVLKFAAVTALFLFVISQWSFGGEAFAIIRAASGDVREKRCGGMMPQQPQQPQQPPQQQGAGLAGLQ